MVHVLLGSFAMHSAAGAAPQSIETAIEDSQSWVHLAMSPEKRAALLKVLAQLGELEFLPDEAEPAAIRPVFTGPRDRFQYFSSSLATRYGRTDPIPFIYLNRSNLNACALRCDGHSFVGINWGSVILLQDLFSRMMASPKVFPEIGDSRGESAPPRLPIVPIDVAELPCRPGNPFALAVEPRSLARMLYASYLTQIALDFLFMHEYQHVAGGHLEFFAHDRRSMSEVGPESDAGDWMTSHVLELEADAAAGNFSLNNVYARAGLVNRVLAPFLKTEKALAQSWLFAVHTLYVVMNDASDRAFLAGRPPPVTHPAAIFRRGAMANLVFARRGPFDDTDMALRAGAEMIVAAHDALAEVVDGRERDLKFGLDLFGENDGRSALMRRWKEMRPRLRTLAAANGSQSAPSDLVRGIGLGPRSTGLIFSNPEVVQVKVHAKRH